MQQRLSKNAVLEEKSVILVLIRERVKRKSSITKSRTFVNRSRWDAIRACLLDAVGLRKEKDYRMISGDDFFAKLSIVIVESSLSKRLTTFKDLL